MSVTNSYYDRYWDDPPSAPPSSDPTTAERKELLRRGLSGLPPGAAVLDAGCGGGEFTQFISDLGFRSTGIDLSEKAIEFARRSYPTQDFRVGGPEDFTAEFSEKFQAIWSSEVIEHIFDVYQFLVSLRQCLAPGGKLVLTTPYHGLIKNVLIDVMNPHLHYQPFGGHIRFFNKRSLGYCLDYCGFTVRKWSAFGRMWPVYKSFFVVAERTHAPQPPPPAKS
jgi:2-polyprenyl-3-methyl-5-hydroxy-6-metoxy-1,4-benzoquinol methylase